MFLVLQIILEFRPNDQLDQPRLVQCPQQRNMSKQVHRAQRRYVPFIATYLRCFRSSKSFWSSGQMFNWINHDWYNVLSNGTCPNRFIELRDIIQFIATYLRCSRSSKSFWSSGQMFNWINHDWYNVLSKGTCPNRFIELKDSMYNSLPRI